MCHAPLCIHLEAKAGHWHPMAPLIQHEGLTVIEASGGDYFHKAVRSSYSYQGRIRGGAQAGDCVRVHHSDLYGLRLYGFLHEALLVLPFNEIGFLSTLCRKRVEVSAVC